LAIQTRRRSGLEASKFESGPLQNLGEAKGRRFVHPSSRNTAVTYMDETTQESTGRQDHRLAGNLPPIL
jgi:hypothetical protein